MILPASYSNGFAPRDGRPLYPELWRGCVFAAAPCLGPTGLTLRDWSGYANHGTLANMVAGDDWGVSGGKYALDFDGTNDFVTCSSPVLSGAVSQFSASCWVKTTASDDKSIFAKYYTTTNNRSWLMFIPNAASGATTEFAVNLSSNGAATLKSYRTTSVSINTGSWRHIGFSFSSGVLLLYVDGIERATTKTVDGAGSSFNWPNAIPLTMSAINTLGTPAALHQCQSDDFMCWNRVVTPREFAMLASRRGIAYELAPRRRSSSAVQFNRRRRLLLGASS